MDYIDPYVYIRKTESEPRKIITYFENFIKNGSKDEGFIDLEYSSEILRVTYYKVLSSIDFIYDKTQDKVLTDQVNKVVTAKISLNPKKKTLLIWGRPSSYKSIMHLLYQGEVSIEKYILDYKALLNSFNKYTYQILRISFRDLNVMDTFVSVATFELLNNNDANNLINWYVNTKLDSFFKVFPFVFNRA
jgi:hypothetical protein